MNPSELTEFATRYAAGWSGQNPQDLASCYAEAGSLCVNAGNPSVGRVAIGPDGLIVESKGHFDEAKYQRQVAGDGTAG